MKIGSLVLCVKPILQLERRRPYTVSNVFRCKCGQVAIELFEVKLTGHLDGSRCNCGRGYYGVSRWNIERFREIKFPPALQQEINECLTRELETV